MLKKQPKGYCPICGNELGKSDKSQVEGVTVCSKCYLKLPVLPTGSDPITLAEAKGLITRAESKELYEGPVPEYAVIQVVLKEAMIGSGSANLSELEIIINRQAAKGYRLHTITTTSGGSKGIGGGDRIQATMVFEKLR